ncbi:14655_t:CDS:1, partial [Racocetra persica]
TDKNINMDELLYKSMFMAVLMDYNRGEYKASFKTFREVSNYQINTRYKDNAKYYLALHYKNRKPFKNNYNAYYFFNQVAQSDSTYKDDAKY